MNSGRSCWPWLGLSSSPPSRGCSISDWSRLPAASARYSVDGFSARCAPGTWFDSCLYLDMGTLVAGDFLPSFLSAAFGKKGLDRGHRDCFPGCWCVYKHWGRLLLAFIPGWSRYLVIHLSGSPAFRIAGPSSRNDRSEHARYLPDDDSFEPLVCLRGDRGNAGHHCNFSVRLPQCFGWSATL